jgi:hypothetical protein
MDARPHQVVKVAALPIRACAARAGSTSHASDDPSGEGLGILFGVKLHQRIQRRVTCLELQVSTPVWRQAGRTLERFAGQPSSERLGRARRRGIIEGFSS